MTGRARDLRILSAIAERLNFSSEHGLSHFGSDGVAKRDLYDACGYDRKLTPQKYWDRFRRNGVARRLVTSLPNATWRTGAELIEDESPDIVTPFEEAFLALDARLGVWKRLRTADILAQLGPFAGILIGAPGMLNTELPRLRKPEDVAYLRPLSSRRIEYKNDQLESDPHNHRFGQPKYYTVKGLPAKGTTGTAGVQVHYSRVIHIADDPLEDDLNSDPRLASVWNWLDDLGKVAGSGSEAFWRRVQPLLAAKLKPGAVVKDETAIEEEIDKLVHGLRRWARLSGVDLEEVGTTDVANFANQIDSLISLIVAGYGIPKRILVGSERGELASQQDRSNWDQQVSDRRTQFAESIALRPLVDRLIQYGALPEPDTYIVRWPDIRDMDTSEKLALAKTMSETNKNQGEQVFRTNEIRDAMGIVALEEDEIIAVTQPGTPPADDGSAAA